ncbi:TetR/AcrR family transcriptional regulator [Puniceicoccaceae bacterium K14]|nr:TetR/AcrR family transcriptional regulator [Puniceicoccaceae bacterium K14]
MPRPREYDRQVVLDRASDVFSRKGFECTSMSDLVEATGLNTASMYKEFGSKDGLFEEVLGKYRMSHIKELIKQMEAKPCMASLTSYLENLREYARSSEFQGCLIMNNLAERNTASDRTMSCVSELCSRLEELIEGCLIQGQHDGEFSKEKDAKHTANFILCFVHGLVLYARMEERQRNMPGIFDQIFATLKN